MTYALVVAGVGIVTVFLFLTLLSLIMTATTRLLGAETETSGAAAEAATAVRQSRTTGAAGARGTDPSAERGQSEPSHRPAWVYAAAAAYLESEERDAVSSRPWVATRRGVSES